MDNRFIVLAPLSLHSLSASCCCFAYKFFFAPILEFFSALLAVTFTPCFFFLPLTFARYAPSDVPCATYLFIGKKCLEAVLISPWHPFSFLKASLTPNPF